MHTLDQSATTWKANMIEALDPVFKELYVPYLIYSTAVVRQRTPGV
jgi:hypothetical protein